jgi:1-acyl-sn-glycerol-3-phosphate acyltransferase
VTAPDHRSPHSALPRSDRARHPARGLLHSLRPLARGVLRGRYAVRVHGSEHVPTRGPVIFASNHVGALDGPLLAVFAPRPVHTLTKHEMFHGRLGPVLRAAGQIPLDRFHSDPGAVKTALRVLRDGGALGIFPEGRRGDGELGRFHRGAAYFALVSGAPVVPVVMLGTREPGGHLESLPRPGGAVDVVFGAPFRCEPRRWPRTKEQVEHLSMLIREHMLVHLDLARALTGQELPGPLPADEVEPDPATGVTEQGAT